MKKTNQQKPWLDSRGIEIPTLELKEISKNWDLNTWQRYADSLETAAQGKSLCPGLFRKLEEHQTKSIFHNIDEAFSSPALTAKINTFLSTLSEKQRQAIEHIFYQGRSIAEAARELGVSKAVLHRHKNTALAKLKQGLAVTGDGVAAYEGVSDSLDDRKTREEQILDVMFEEISREDNALYDFDQRGMG